MKNKISYKVKRNLSFLALLIVGAFVGIGISVVILYFMGVL